MGSGDAFDLIRNVYKPFIGIILTQMHRLHACEWIEWRPRRWWRCRWIVIFYFCINFRIETISSVRRSRRSRRPSVLFSCSSFSRRSRRSCKHRTSTHRRSHRTASHVYEYLHFSHEGKRNGGRKLKQKWEVERNAWWRALSHVSRQCMHVYSECMSRSSFLHFANLKLFTKLAFADPSFLRRRLTEIGIVIRLRNELR